MIQAATASTHAQIKHRITEAGLSWDSLGTNLEKKPSCVPRAHCITHFKYVMNGFLTTSRLRFMHEVTVLDCPFCGERNGDTRNHWVACRTLCPLFNDTYGGTTTLVMAYNVFHMQIPLDGREIQLLLAFIHAIWRCRCVIVRGLAFSDDHDLAAHFRSVIEDPWLHGNPTVLSRTERREVRRIPPHLPGDTLVYFFDGASRKTNGGRMASFGAQLRWNGTTIARIAVFIGDATNNEAEYQGALVVLRHALSSGISRVRVYGDSKLVISQLNGVWKCKAPNLVPHYEQGLDLMRRLHHSCEGGELMLAHIYREYNADADSLANIAIDRRISEGVAVVADNWDDPHYHRRS